MAVDMFLKIAEIPGESVDADANHKGTMDILAWSWGMSQSGTTHSGPGGGAGKVNVQDISVTKYVDIASPLLMLYCSGGKHLKEALLTVRKAGDKPLEYMVIKMTDAIVTSVSTGGSGGEDRLTENVSLNFAKVEYKYTSQKTDGSAGDKKEYKWDIAGNAKL
ncbi:type VI secretion system tube protein Hcp [Inquilinus sp. CAU 1745]|uniref:Hcp family type VI secretion system effector n=1 Tax=Inquilinus sp. CAU 1745 TaxID=3140369 RepID=UPI00325B2B26